MRALIFAAGDPGEPEDVRRAVQPRPEDLVLAADAGALHALALGLRPALVLGDLDSAPPRLLQKLAAQGIPIRAVPRDKDQTDTHLAVLEALRRGAEAVVLIGAGGSRLDHTLANLQVLAGLDPAVRVSLVGRGYVAWLVGPHQELEVPPEPGSFLSLLPLTPEVTGVHARGVRWELADATLRWGESRGVSNEFAGGPARIRAGEGRLLVVVARD